MSAPERLRVPQQDGAVIAHPSLSEFAAVLAENRRRLDAANGILLGWPLSELRAAARHSAIAAAETYLREAGEPLPAGVRGETPALLLAGHQPELFHPGVWLKHFCLNGLARQHQLTPLNLIVDNDTAKSTLLRLPERTSANGPTYRLASIPYDNWSGEVPYEERVVRDEGLFASLAERAAATVAGWPFKPLLAEFWAEAVRQVQRTPLLGERLAAARRWLERRWGCHNLEVPLSRLCATEPFAWFACHLLLFLPLFWAVYNAVVQEYRNQHGIRSRNHPVPDLTREGDWLEAPFWAWRAGQSRRHRLFVRRTQTALVLRAGGETWPALPAPRDFDSAKAARLVQAWQELEQRGFKVRTRALTTTLYARLFLADVFVHGIGGGNYDELTDGLIRHFYFGSEPPRYLVLSGTLRLPLERFTATEDQRQQLVQELRDLDCNPQRHLGTVEQVDPPIRELAERKREWIARLVGNRWERRERFQALRQLTTQLRPALTRRRQLVAEALRRSQEELQANEVARRRDYAFCLYPEELLRGFCTSFGSTQYHPAEERI